MVQAAKPLARHPKSRREQDRRLKEAVAVMGESVVLVLIDAVIQKSERPLRKLPDEWRDRAISSFRQFVKKQGGSHD